MKKFALLFSALALIISGLAHSQSSGIGVIGGLNFSNLNSKDSDTSGSDYSSLLGYKGGAVLDLSLAKNFGLRLEPMYLQKGAERNGFFQDEHGQSFPVKSDVKLSYLELPVLFKYSMGNGNIRPYLVGGAGVSYLLSAKEKFTGGYAVPDQEIDIKDDFKSIDFEISGGAGLNFSIGKASLFVEGRYSHGLANIYDSEDLELNTKGIQIMVGCSFPLSGSSTPDPSVFSAWGYCNTKDNILLKTDGKVVSLTKLMNFGDCPAYIYSCCDENGNPLEEPKPVANKLWPTSQGPIDKYTSLEGAYAIYFSCTGDKGRCDISFETEKPLKDYKIPCCTITEIKVTHQGGGEYKGDIEKMKDFLEKYDPSADVPDNGFLTVFEITTIHQPKEVWATFIKGVLDEKDAFPFFSNTMKKAYCKGEDIKCKIIKRESNGVLAQNQTWPPFGEADAKFWAKEGAEFITRGINSMLEKCECDPGETHNVWPEKE